MRLRGQCLRRTTKKIRVLCAANKRNKKHTIVSNKSKADSSNVLSPAAMDVTDAAEALLVLNEELGVDGAAMAMLFESSSDDEEESVLPHDCAPNKERNFIAANEMVTRHCFNGRRSAHNEKDFERRFRCPRDTHNRVHQDLMGEDPFTHKMDATGKPGMFPLVKPVACFRHIACGDACDGHREQRR